jgi:uncharacterized protein
MHAIFRAAKDGNLAEVQRHVGQKPVLLNSKGRGGRTALMLASEGGHVAVVRWLLDQGAAMDEQDKLGRSALWSACFSRRAPVVKLLLERGADPTIASGLGTTPLMAASTKNVLKIVRWLLACPSAKATIDRRDKEGQTALWQACYRGRRGVARALLEGGADFTIINNAGITPKAVAMENPPRGICPRGRQECVAELKVRVGLALCPPDHFLLSPVV